MRLYMVDHLYETPSGLRKVLSAILVIGELDDAANELKIAESRLKKILTGKYRPNDREKKDISLYLLKSSTNLLA
jgi:hypothetical protein